VVLTLDTIAAEEPIARSRGAPLPPREQPARRPGRGEAHHLGDTPGGAAHEPRECDGIVAGGLARPDLVREEDAPGDGGGTNRTVSSRGASPVRPASARRTFQATRTAAAAASTNEGRRATRARS